MPSHSSALSQRVIALAAMTQAIYLVNGIARKGTADTEDCRVMMESIFADGLESPNHGRHQSVADLYGGLHHLDTGLRICSKLLQGEKIADAKDLMIYSVGLIALENRLRKNAPMRQKLADGMQRISHQRQYFGDAMHHNVTAAIADLYGSTISTMKPRIIVRGKTEHLSQSVHTQRVRALLMAGLRAAHLWHQHGGGHLNLLLRRKALLRELEILQT
ncbi:high frequency lysogenization protein HflD [Mariprofundus ferrooxydans]|nr:high frequency lysogenization protein HflD [Mariprofundus ferrooxydans]